MAGGAEISEDGQYRYRLWRRWGSGDDVVWIMLNPSTADALVDDPTVRRCISFSQTWGFGGLQVINLYALRATNPAALVQHPDPEGPENAKAWGDAGWRTDGRTFVAAWGMYPPRSGLRRSHMHPGRVPRGLSCLGTTADGHPKHPLYVKANTPLVPWTP